MKIIFLPSILGCFILCSIELPTSEFPLYPYRIISGAHPFIKSLETWKKQEQEVIDFKQQLQVKDDILTRTNDQVEGLDKENVEIKRELEKISY
jgi:hypothetical protein